jgi:hypothetical protein
MDSLITEAIADEPSGSSLQLSRSRTGSPEYVDTSATGYDIDSEASGDDVDQHCCFYIEHLVSKEQSINDQDDYFLVEHLNAGHLTPCDPLSAATADATVLTAPIREELPSDQVHCLESVDIRQKLLSSRHIRLLKLYPATKDHGNEHAQKSSPLRCEVYQVSLDNLTTDGPPLFAAASYVCGDQTHVERILCGRQKIGIPQNVYDVLCHLRVKSRPRLVWIDYLCINQRDSHEKSHQVRMLHKIYAQAHVVSWLGDGSGLDLNLVIFYLSMCAQLWIEAVRTDKSEKAYFELRRESVAHLESYIDSQATVEPHHRAMQELVSIANAEYFRRVWIVQEFILGKTNACQIGDTLHSVAVLAASAQVLTGLFRRRPYLDNQSKSPTKKGEGDIFERASLHYFDPALHNYWLPGPGFDAPSNDLEVVTTANIGVCSDPRDYIYGVTSFFNDPNSYPVDYTLSDAEVFADFTVYCMSNDRSISVLNPGRLATGVKNARSDLPTWCPDWSVAGSPHSHYSGGGDGVRFDRVAQEDCGWQASGMTELVYSRPSKLTLALRGFAVSRLKLCSDSALSWPESDDDDDDDDWPLSPYSCSWWSENSESLCTFFERQGLKIDSNSKDMVLRVFERTLHPADLGIPKRVVISKELRLLLDRADHAGLVSLLAPLYLAQVDPELFKAAGFEVDERIPSEDYDIVLGEISRSLWFCSREMRLFFTEDGMMGTGYASIEEGDLVCIIFGSRMPQILRQSSSDGHYFLVAECHIDGLMFGEGLEMKLTEQEFILV